MSESSDRDVEVFTKALELPVGERAAYLESACGGDAELRRRVEALLAGHSEVGDFLEQSPHETSGQLKPRAAVGEKPGDRIGRYKLLQQIGEGGCGVVFMAEQEEPVRRRVAVKIIKPGMDTKSVIARFEAERQALALMDHPNIAKIFDAGSTDSGRPYFVMELVRGIKITDYCDQHSLTTEERLGLFVQVCLAIQHAHQKGIIHRDIKPSNILVTQSLEGATLPVVIDFGIAKATTNQRLTDKTLFTAFEMLIGTPAYMSPEQAVLTSVDVDTRTDIYSLGVLLYELLTGSTPFDSSELMRSGLDEIRKVIREREPARPSTRLSKMTGADITTIALRRKSEPPTLIHAVRGDLDWITMKALEKDRTRRYETAYGMALDIQRFLANEPILARPPSRIYQLKKTILRNKLLFAAIGIIGLLLVCSLIVVSSSLAKERQERREAEAASVKSQQVTKFLKEMLGGIGPSVARGRDTAMIREMLDQTAERVGKEMTNQPAVEADVRSLIGQLYDQLGDYARAAAMARTALEIQRTISGPDSPELASSLAGLGWELMALQKYPEAEKVESEALTIRRRVYGEESPETASTLNDLSSVYRDERRLPEAEAMALTSLRIRRTLFTNDNADIAGSLRNLCLIKGYESNWGEAEKIGNDYVAMQERLLGPNHPSIAAALHDAAWAANGNHDFAAAESMESRALAIRQKYLADENPDVGKTLNSLGKLMANRNDLPEAHAVLKAVLAIQGRLLGADDPATLDTLSSLANVFESEGNWTDAEELRREVIAGWRKHGDAGNHDLLYATRELALTLERDNKWPEAERIWRDSLVDWRKVEKEGGQQSMYTLRKLGLALETEGKWPEAEAVFREALAISRKQSGINGSEALTDLTRVAGALVSEQKFGDAQKLLNDELTPGFFKTEAGQNFLASWIDTLGRRGHFAETATEAAILLQSQPSDHYNYHRLAGLLALTGDRPGYEKICGEIFTNFPNPTNPYIAERIVQDSLLLPHPGVDMDAMAELADSAVRKGTGQDGMPYFQACKAMVEYRRGHYSDAIDWAGKSAQSSASYAQAKALAILAMAHWQLGRLDLAQAALARGNALAPRLAAASGSADLGDSWVAWIFARVSLDEAASLIQPEPAAGNHINAPARKG